MLNTYTNCRKCLGRMLVLDTLPEAYDLICAKCGLREVVDFQIQDAQLFLTSDF